MFQTCFWQARGPADALSKQTLLNRADLDLRQMTVSAVEYNDNEVHIHLKHTIERRKCPRCGSESAELRQNHARIVRDLPISGKACYLHFTKRRFFCTACRQPFSEKLDFVDPYRDYTGRYQDDIWRSSGVGRLIPSRESGV